MADDTGMGKVLAFPTPVQPLNTDKPVMTLDEALGWAWDHGFIE